MSEVAAAPMVAQRDIVLAVRLGRGRSGGSTCLDWIIQRARTEGRQLLIGDGTPNPMLASIYPGTSQPGTQETADVKDWITERLGVMAAECASLILDLGGGDRVLQEYGRDLQISEFCEAIGVKPLALYFTGPEPGDLDNVIATWKAGYFRPERSILVLNEYLVPQNRTVSGAFGPVLDHPAIAEMAEAGLRIVVMTRLPCLQEMRQAGLSFGDVAAGRVGNNGKPLDPVRQFMVTTWMRRMEEGFAKRGATEWLP